MALPRLHFVVGKGGVGKSTVSAALALAHVHRGRRVLAIELGGPGGLARVFGHAADRPGHFVAVRDRLAVGYIDGQSALAEYLDLVLPIRRLLSTVLASRIYKNFVAAAPGLKELMTIGKIWYEFQRCDEGERPIWDVIVVDAGASGHSLQYLQMPATAARTFHTGLVHRESERVAGLLRSADATRVHVVAIAEDMPLAEAAQILTQLRTDLGLPVGHLFVNRWRTVPPEGTEDVLDRLACATQRRAAPMPGCTKEILEGILTSGRRAVAWSGLQRRCLDRFRDRVRAEPVLLPLLVAEEFALSEVERLAQLMPVVTGEKAP